MWAAFKSGPYINFPDNGEEYFDKGSLAIVNGSRPLLVNANGALLRDTPGTTDGDRYYQPIYDDLFSDTGRPRHLQHLLHRSAGAVGQSNRLRRAGARTHIGQFEDGGAYALMTRRAPGGHVSAFRRADDRRVDADGRLPAARHVRRLRPDVGHVGPRIGQWLAFHSAAA